MEYSMATTKEKNKLQMLIKTFTNKELNAPVKIELYDNGKMIPAEIVCKYDADVVKHFLITPGETFKAGYLQYLWEKELFKWVWGSKELNIEP